MENAHAEYQEISQNCEIMLLIFEFLSWFGNNNVGDGNDIGFERFYKSFQGS